MGKGGKGGRKIRRNKKGRKSREHSRNWKECPLALALLSISLSANGWNEKKEKREQKGPSNLT
jgi:hypothetical protein